MSTSLIIVAIVLLFLAPTLFKGLKVLIKALIGMIDFLLALFIPIGRCSCGEKTICVNGNNDGYALICQNYHCRKRTNRYKSLIKAKSEWSEIRGK